MRASCDQEGLSTPSLPASDMKRLCAVAAILGLSVHISHPKWHGCEETYWKKSCRLNRGDTGYNNFLAHAGLLLPPIIHQTATAEELYSGRILFLGDIHGCRDEFQEILEKAKFKKGTDNLILVGDLVDKGPYSAEVIEEARKWGALSVRGNHDDTALAAYEDYTRGHKVKGKHKWVKQLKKAEAEWLSKLPWSLSLPDHGIVVVHAGMVPEVPLEKQLLVDLNHMREVGPGEDTKYRGMESKTVKGKGKAWAKVWDGPQHIIFGHDHKKGLQDEKFATGIDTGVVHGLHLTGLLIPGSKAMQARALPTNSSQGSLMRALDGKFITVKAKRNYAKDDASDFDNSGPSRAFSDAFVFSFSNLSSLFQ